MAQIKTHILAIALIACSINTSAQQTGYMPSAGQRSSLELFAGVDFNYRDILLTAPYKVLLNLTPGIKWNIYNQVLVNAGGVVPLINQFGDGYSRVRLEVLSVSRQFKIGKIALKPSVGLFTQERYGFDLKAFYPVTDWLAFEAQAGYTGYLTMARGWDMSPLSRALAIGGMDLYFSKWNTQVRITGGRFLKDDNGIVLEGFRHFRNTSIGVYLLYSNFNSITGRNQNNYNGGFKIIVGIPPSRGRQKSVQFRPANNFRFTYNMNADPHSCQVYHTDSEQNERHGWFSPNILPWGANTINNNNYERANNEKSIY